jgi:hypothetical protein
MPFDALYNEYTNKITMFNLNFHGVTTDPLKAFLNDYTGCPRRNVPDFGRVFLMLKYTDITQNTYVQS